MREELLNVIRNRFRAPRPRRLQLGLALQSGYRALDLLDASVAGDRKSTSKIQSLLERTPGALRKRAQRKRVVRRLDLSALDPPPEHKFLAKFPREKVEGIRRVPFLVNANGLPFVRWRKDQPKNVSRMIRQQLKQRQNYFNRKAYIEEQYLPLAKLEDQWDCILERFSDDPEFFREVDVSYQRPVIEVLRDMRKWWSEKQKKTAELVRKMTYIVDRERELARKEAEERKQVNETTTANADGRKGPATKHHENELEKLIQEVGKL